MLNFLDIRTLSMVMGVSILISSISMLSYSFHRKTYISFNFWIAALLCCGIGLFLVSLRDVLPDFVSIVLSNVFLLYGFCLFYLGLKVIGDKKGRICLHMALMTGLSLTAFPFFTYVFPSVNIRISLLSFTGAIYFILDARVLIMKNETEHVKDNMSLIISLILLSIALTLRGFFYLYPGNMVNSYMNSGSIQGIFLLVFIMLYISFIMGLMQLNAQILEQNLYREEKRLRESEERYRQLVEESRQGLIIARNNPVQFCFISDPMKIILGYTPTELKEFTPTQLMQLIHFDDQKKFLENFQNRVMGKNIPPTQQYRIIHKTLGTRWIETYSTFIEYEGKPAIHSHFLDITPRKQAEAINSALFTISNAVNTAPSLEALYASIHTCLGTIIDVTNFFIALVDTTRNTLYFPYHVDTTDDDFSPITAFDTDKSLTGLVVANCQPILLQQEELMERARQNGVWGPVPLIWLGVPLMIKDKVIGVVTVQSYTNANLYTEKELDILSAVSHQMAIAIERKQTEDALVESEKKYRQLFLNAPAGICEIDFDEHKFIKFNDVMCQYSGYSKEELMVLNPLDLLDDPSKNKSMERVERLARGEKVPSNAEFNMIKKNGEKLTVLMSSDFILDKGHVKGVRMVIHDISERIQLEQEKIKAQKLAGEHKKLALVGQIAGKMAHDFNNILGIVMGNIELMLMDCEDPAMKKTLGMILTQTIRGKNMTRNLVAFARNQEPRQCFFDVNEKIDMVLALMKKDLEGIQVTKRYEPHLPDLLADPGMVEHALVNLLQNAIHALGKTSQPEITLTTHLVDTTQICIEITDNGCGIPQEHLDRIYEPAFTLKGSNDTSGSYHGDVKGTGYGMGNVQKYIHQHKGSIEVQSYVNAGTTIRITLPVIEKQLTVIEKEEISQTPLHSGKQILLVEDEPDISHVQCRILTHSPCNHRVDGATNGKAAIDLFDKGGYDLVSLDYMLPGTHNGMDVYKHIRQRDKDIPVLFISGNIEFLESIKTLKEQDSQVEHLSKPCMNKVYVQSINALLDQLSSTSRMVSPISRREKGLST